jgi:hypothetical protein
MSKNTSKPFYLVLFWEFLQNLPLGIGFIIGGHFWGISTVFSIGLMILCGISSGTIIRVTEKRIVDHYTESIRASLGNMCIFSIVMLGLNAYFASNWGNIFYDLLFGSFSGVLLSITQSTLEQQKISISHTVAFAICTFLVIISLRMLLNQQFFPLWGVIFSVTLIISIIITKIDYF